MRSCNSGSPGINYIDFEFLSVKIDKFDRNDIIDWIKRVFEIENKDTYHIQYIFCDDNTLLEINKKYLEHDTLTDIITFNYNDETGMITGDIFISYERVVENASTYNVSVFNELDRVIIHGILHLIGYDDQTLHQEQIMREKEDYYLKLR